MGHEVEVIDRPGTIHRPFWRNAITFVKRVVLWAMGERVSLCYQKEYNEREHAKRKYVNMFVRKYVNRRVLSRYDLISQNDYQAIVVGSDQIWRICYIQRIGGVKICFLDFTKGWDVKRIAYAASFGIDKWNYTEEETMIAKKAIQRFKAVSIREKSGVSLCEKYLEYNDAVHVLDPTMLLTVKDYEQLVEQSEVTRNPEGEAMVYVLDSTEEKDLYIANVVKKLGLQSFEANSKCEDSDASLEEITQPPVEQWLRGFRDSKFVITDSFHACVFSIIFHKPFIVIGNKERGLSRFCSLLEAFGLQDRLVQEQDTVNVLDMDIDWEKVDERLENMRIHSKDFLENALVD